MSVQLHLHFYKKQKNTGEDALYFHRITGYEVERWVDNDHIQIVDIYRRPGEDALKMLNNLLNYLSRSPVFRGWLAFPDFATHTLYYTPCIEIDLVSLQFTSLISPFELNPHFEARRSETCKVVANFEHDIRRIMIYICEEGGTWNRVYIKYDDLGEHIVQQVTEDNTMRLVLRLKCSPSFWESKPEVIANKKKKLQRDQYRRDELDRKLRLKTPWSRIRTLTADNGTFDIPKCSAIVLTYPCSAYNISRVISGFKKHQFQCFFTKFEDLRYPAEDDTKASDWVDELMTANPDHVDNINLRYALKCLESLGFQFLDKLYKTSPEHKRTFYRYLRDKIAQNSVDRIDYVTQAIYKLAMAFDKDPFLDPSSVFELYFDKVDVRPCSLESHYQYIKRMIVTPSRTIFVPPEPIAINRILRQHISYVDNFARVCFRDEDFSPFNVHSEAGTENVRQVIENGVKLSEDVVFQFLACSNSQLRSQGLWLFYPQCPLTVESIRESIGDLNKMKTTQKYVTRMGLAFTATDFSLSEEVAVEELPENDRVVGDKRFIFSDGVGCISPGVQDLIIREKYGENHQYRPVAFQVRIGGCKGMVAVNPDLGNRMVVQIRPSMKKFESSHKNIEPCGYSAPRDLHMNRQVIAILRAQGVPDNNFISLQNKSLLELADMLTMERLASIEMGTKLRIKTSDLEKSCIRITTEPFLRRQLVSLYKFRIRDAIAKTRFRIDHAKGRQMKGIMDETNTLNYGEIFVQYTDLGNLSKDARIVLEGDVFITKNPCLHPGDLKRVVAVDVPHLHHLYDVVVFPGKGQRPHPNELSGSDLDGDEYFVCWEESLMPNLNCEPAEYYIETISPDPPGGAEEKPLNITEDEINEFVFSYITKGSKLGQISNAHAIWADRLPKGVLEKQCIKLASKHSDAVDFIKTGIAPTFEFSERSLIYPDWMMKPDKASYSSKTAIGKMFHVVEGLENAILHLNVSDEDIAPSEIFLLDRPPTPEELDSATRHYHEYCNELANIMIAYGIEDEGDMAAGCLNTVKMSLAKEHERNYDMREQCLSMFRNLQRKYKRAFFTNAGVTQYNWKKAEDDVMRQAAAWYWVAYNKPQKHQGLVLLSFPWCVANILIKIPELMNTNGTPNSVKASLKCELKRWYVNKSQSEARIKEKGREVFRWLTGMGVARVTDISRYSYGLIPGNTFIYHIDMSPKRFALELKQRLSEMEVVATTAKEVVKQLKQMVADFRKSHAQYAVSEVNVNHPTIKTVKVILTNDDVLLRKVNILKQYCQKYDIIGHTMYLILNWAEKNGITNGQDADIGMSFLEFMLQKVGSQISPIPESDLVSPEVVIGQYPHRNTATLYLEYLKCMIKNCHRVFEGATILDNGLLSPARGLLTTEKFLIAAMREYHYVSYSLTFESSVSFKQLSIMRKKDKKMCFNIARATSFCATYFSSAADNSSEFGTDGQIDIKIRETELGAINALVLEIWGDNPQKMNDIADAFQVDESKFQLYGSYLHIRGPDYHQLNFVAPKSIDRAMPLYFSLRRHGSKPREKAELKQDIEPIYYEHNLKELINNELQHKARVMREGLYNKISHGELSVSTTFGRLKLKRFEHGKLEKEHMALGNENKQLILKKLRGITRHSYKESGVSYIFNILYEEIPYRLVFDKDYKPKSLSLTEITWTDMMILNNRGADLNLMVTSTHTLSGDDLQFLPLTHDLLRGVRWIERIDTEKGIQLVSNKDSIPCYIKSIEVVTEKRHRFVKDPALKDLFVSELEIDVYQNMDKHYMKYSRSYAELKLTSRQLDLANSELLKTYQKVALDLATVHKVTTGVWKGGRRGDSAVEPIEEGATVPRPPRSQRRSRNSSENNANRRRNNQGSSSNQVSPSNTISPGNLVSPRNQVSPSNQYQVSPSNMGSTNTLTNQTELPSQNLAYVPPTTNNTPSPEDFANAFNATSPSNMTSPNNVMSPSNMMSPSNVMSPNNTTPSNNTTPPNIYYLPNFTNSPGYPSSHAVLHNHSNGQDHVPTDSQGAQENSYINLGYEENNYSNTLTEDHVENNTAFNCVNTTTASVPSIYQAASPGIRPSAPASTHQPSAPASTHQPRSTHQPSAPASTHQPFAPASTHHPRSNHTSITLGYPYLYYKQAEEPRGLCSAKPEPCLSKPFTTAAQELQYLSLNNPPWDAGLQCEQRAESSEQRAESSEQRAESSVQDQEGEEQGGGRGSFFNHQYDHMTLSASDLQSEYSLGSRSEQHSEQLGQHIEQLDQQANEQYEQHIDHLIGQAREHLIEEAREHLSPVSSPEVEVLHEELQGSNPFDNCPDEETCEDGRKGRLDHHQDEQ